MPKAYIIPLWFLFSAFCLFPFFRRLISEVTEPISTNTKVTTRTTSIHSCFIFESLLTRIRSSSWSRAVFCSSCRMSFGTGSDEAPVFRVELRRDWENRRPRWRPSRFVSHCHMPSLMVPHKCNSRKFYTGYVICMGYLAVFHALSNWPVFTATAAVPLTTSNHAKFSTFCIAFHIFLVSGDNDFKFGR